MHSGTNILIHHCYIGTSKDCSDVSTGFRGNFFLPAVTVVLLNHSVMGSGNECSLVNTK